MRILLVAGAGFIGPPVARRLVGHDVAVLHTGEHEPPLPDSVVHLHNKNVRPHIKSFPREAIDWRPDVVIHFLLFNDEDARACVEAFAGVARRVVMLSSGDVYRAYGQLIGREPAVDEGAAKHEGATENARLHHENSALLNEESPLRTELYPYGKAIASPWGTSLDYDKILAERVIASEPSLPATILRLPKVYGPGDRHSIFARWLEHLRAHDTIPVGERQGRWRWTHGHVEDVAAAIALAAVDERATGRVYNVGEPAARTQRQRLEDVARAMKWPGRILDVADEELPAALRDSHAGAPDIAYDTSRIRRELGFEEVMRYEDAIASVV